MRDKAETFSGLPAGFGYHVEGEYLVLSFGEQEVWRAKPGELKLNRLEEGFEPPRGEEPGAQYKNIVFVGDSLTRDIGQSLTTPSEKATAIFQAEGMDVTVYGWGWSGYHIKNGTLKLAEALNAFGPDTNTLFVVTLGMNDVNTTKPYASATQEQKDRIAADYAAMVTVIGDRMGDCIINSIPFADFDTNGDGVGEVKDDASLGTLAYNTALMLPIQNDKFKNSDGYPVLDWYGMTMELQPLMHPDGIHYTAEGNRLKQKKTAQRLAYLFTGEGMPPPYSHEPSLASIANPNACLVNFGVSAINGTGKGNGQGVTRQQIIDKAVIPLIPNNKTAPVLSLTFEHSVSATNELNMYFTNVIVDRDFDYSLGCDPFYKETLFVRRGVTMTLIIQGLAANASVNLGFMGYRSASSENISIVEDVLNPANAAQWNTSDLQAEEATLTVTANGNGEASVSLKPGPDSTFAYLGGMRISP
ncbi:SGNH/GDSL hydrolase family protein [Grimontia kaedaensis]|uniref:SGNH/GDSL hydrolase family protein n=1 Tax=Grimontia kaedaensis TaxID=2872157 RepID=A0ABY4WXK7_9GAMM|nr:SGNH/GDSL hydrolase family protein [Grimontia kaedaensis]USH03714.1 SGNH/GDSL hydrolase family protein [Grimontia kaedaensis]